MSITRARRSTDAIEKLYISMRHLFHRGVYRPSGAPGKILRNLLFEINPEIYGSMTDPNKVELSGLMYVLDRLPIGIVETPYVCFTSDEGYDRSIFTPIIPSKRRRFCYRIDDEQMNIEISRGRSDIYDVLTHLTFLYNEADKIRNRAFNNETLSKSRVWEVIEEVVFTKEEISRKEREVALMHLSTILGRTFEETQEIHNYFGTNEDKDRFFRIVYWMGYTSQQDRIGKKKREITFTSTLRESIGHHMIGEKWANEIKRVLFENNLQNKNIHIISANMHSVSNMLYAYDGLKRKYKNDGVEIYEDLSASNNKILRDSLNDYTYRNCPIKNIFGQFLLLYDDCSCANLLYVDVHAPEMRNSSGERITKWISNHAFQQGFQGTYNVSSSFNDTDLLPYCAEETDLRSNPSQVGEDDVILASNGTGEMDQLEPELKEVEERPKELLEPEGTNDKDLEVPIGPMTRSKQARFRQALHQLLHTIQGNLECANPTTLVVI